MTEPILDPRYWRTRLSRAMVRKEMQEAIFLCSKPKWEAIAESHRKILAGIVGDCDSVLDAGCAWGRLLDLMPSNWVGDYSGIDISPDFIQLARGWHPHREFIEGDMSRLSQVYSRKFDLAVLISIRPMVQRNLGGEVWEQIGAELKKVCRKVLYLEYDENDPGSLEVGNA